MNSTEDKRIFAWYQSYTTAIRQLKSIKDKYQMLSALMDYGTDGIEPHFVDTDTCPAFALQAIFEACRVNLDNSRKSYKNGYKGAEHGKKGGAPKNGETAEEAYERRNGAPKTESPEPDLAPAPEVENVDAILAAASEAYEQELLADIVY